MEVEAPTAGQDIGLEIGRGIGGNSFMDLTGRDPDVATNLLVVTLADAASEAALPAPPQVYLDVRLDDGESGHLAQTVSPDSDHFWLDLVIAEPVQLTAGDHMLRYEYAGEENDNPGLAKVDAFYLQPVVGQRVYLHPDGRRFTLAYDTRTGLATWDEQDS